MNEEQAKPAELEELGEAAPEAPAAPESNAPPTPEGVEAPPQMAAAAGPPPVLKQLYQFLYSGIAVLFGCCIPLTTHAVGWNADSYDATLRGPIGLTTVGGSVAGFIAVMFIAIQVNSIKQRRIAIKPIFLMAFVAFWSWKSALGGLAASASFGSGDKTWLNAVVTMDVSWWSDYWTHVGPGYIFIMAGSAVPILIFLQALVGIGAKKKKPAAAGAEGGRGRGRRRR